MNGERAGPAGMAEVLDLAAELSERIRSDQAVGIPISGERITGLAKAAMLLEEYGVPWPDGMMQVLQEIERNAGSPAAPEPEPTEDAEGSDPERSSPTASGILGRLVSFGRARRD